MALRSRYTVTKESDSGVDDLNNKFPDILTLPVDKFIYKYAPSISILTQMDIERFDIFVYSIYGSSEFNDLLLIFNNVFSKYDLVIGQKLIIPDKRDIDQWFLKNIK
jgi:hypothetical protein